MDVNDGGKDILCLRGQTIVDKATRGKFLLLENAAQVGMEGKNKKRCSFRFIHISLDMGQFMGLSA